MYRLIIGLLLLLLTRPGLAQDTPDSVYINITPSFVTNYDEGARLKYLKARVALKVLTEGQEMVQHHLPSIKNTLVIMFSSQAEENLTSTVARESFRREALEEVKRLMSMLERNGHQQIEDLYFTDFVVQQ